MQPSLFSTFAETGQLPIAADLAVVPRNVEALRITGETKNPDLLRSFEKLRSLAARDVGQRHFEAITSTASLENLDLFVSRVGDLAPISRLSRLRGLSVAAFSRVETLADIARLEKLELLRLSDLPRIGDFAPLAGLRRLRGLALSGSFTKAQKAASLDFLDEFDALTELVLDGVRLADGDLRPVARRHSLRFLSLGNGFPVREYARLSIALAGVECDAFRPTRPLRSLTWDPKANAMRTDPVGFDTVLIGKPVKLLRSRDAKDAALIAKRTVEFERWQAYYRGVPDPAADGRPTLPGAPKPRTRPNS